MPYYPSLKFRRTLPVAVLGSASNGQSDRPSPARRSGPRVQSESFGTALKRRRNMVRDAVILWQSPGALES